MNEFFISELKSKVTLSSLIARYIPIQTKGGKKMACCPFHQEKTPSFNILDEKGFYHCFGCGTNGDAINFLQQHLGISFIEAVKELCLLTGTPAPQSRPQNQETQKKLDILQEVLEFMQQELQKSSNAKNYLQKRQITQEVQSHFTICYGGSRKDGLYNFLKLCFLESEIEKSGVCIKSSYNSTFFDRFSNRIIFPIHSHSGKVIAFSGRIFNGEKNTAKYINSPETEIFKKGEVLYNFHNARKTKEKFVIVCEGFMDVIAFFKDGIANAVAQMGTAFSQNHLQTLTSRFEEVVFCFDADNAGITAQKRVIETLFTQIDGSKKFSFIATPTTKDPDEHLTKYGANSLKTLVNQRISLHQHAWNLWQNGIDFQNPEEVLRLERFIESILLKNKLPEVQKNYRFFFKNKIFESKFQKKTLSNYKPKAKTKQGIFPFEEGAIIFVYKYFTAIAQRLEDLMSEYEIYFETKTAKQIFQSIIAGKEVEIDDFNLQIVPNFSTKAEMHNYYMMLYQSSMLFKVQKEINEIKQTGNFQRLMFLARERDQIEQNLESLTLSSQ